MFGLEEEMYSDGCKHGFNEALKVAVNLIEGDPRIDPVIGQDLIKSLESMKRD